MSAFVPAEFVNRKNVRVFEFRCGRCFGVKAVNKIVRGGASTRKKFKSDRSIDAELSGLENDAATPTAYFPDELVISEKAAFRERFDRRSRG